MKARVARARPLLTLGLAGTRLGPQGQTSGVRAGSETIPSQAAVCGICSAWVCPGGAGGRGCECGEKALGLLSQKD